MDLQNRRQSAAKSLRGTNQFDAYSLPYNYQPLSHSASPNGVSQHRTDLSLSSTPSDTDWSSGTESDAELANLALPGHPLSHSASAPDCKRRKPKPTTPVQAKTLQTLFAKVCSAHTTSSLGY